ncbi:unnamed protein product [Prunus armeniaca]
MAHQEASCVAAVEEPEGNISQEKGKPSCQVNTEPKMNIFYPKDSKHIMGKDKTHFGGSLPQVHRKQQKAKKRVKHGFVAEL